MPLTLAAPEQQFLRPEDPKFYDLKTAKFVIISAPLEHTVSYGHGTADGPKAILEASSQVEFWDTELKSYPYEAGIATLEPLSFGSDPAADLELIAATFAEVVSMGKIPVMLGGEHTVTLGGIMGLSTARHADGIGERPFTLLQFDAHGDLRFEYDGTVYSHAAVMRQCLARFPATRLVQVGIRAICEEEEQFIAAKAADGRVATFFAHERAQWNAEKILNAIQTDEVYITFDVDGLDSSLMPATGTPVPDGLQWKETLEILRLVAAQKKIIGMDIVELAPRPGFSYCDFATALLTFKMMAYVGNAK